MIAELKHVLTVDIGTTSAKVLLVTQQGDVVFSGQEFYPTQFSAHGWAEQDPTIIYRSVNKLVAECASKHTAISAISLSCAMHSIVVVDQDCNPLSPLIIWSDMRSADIAREIRATPLAAKLLKETGTPVHPMSPLCKVAWLRENDSALFKRACKFVSIKEFLIWHWSGRWVVDYSVASSSGLFDIRRLTWSAEAIAFAGIGTSQLSECISPYQQVPLKENISRLLGFPQPMVIVPGASDGCLAHIGSNAIGQGDISLTIGTSGAVRKLANDPVHDLSGRLFNYRLDEDAFITGGATNNGTVLIDWFRKNFCKSEGNNLNEFVQQACLAPPRAEGLLFLPFVLGERSPYYNPDMRGVFFGLGQHHAIHHMMRSLLEGICFEMKTLVDAVSETVGPVDRVLASGGFIRSPEWVQILANVLGREVHIRDVNDASSMGAAIIGFKSLGENFQFQQVATGLCYTPDPVESSSYRTLYKIFASLIGKVSDEFNEIASLQKASIFRM